MNLSLGIRVVFTLLVAFSTGRSLYAQPEANFIASNTEGCDFLQVLFTDLSKARGASIVEWEWDLAGSIVDLQHPGRLFTTPGTYTICLTVTDANGLTSTLCKEDYITVYPKPEPEFTITDSAGCMPHTVEFTDLSTSPNGNIVTWIWGLGGSNDVVEQTNPNQTITSTYNYPDEYTTSLTVIDEKGCVATIVKPDLIVTQPHAEVFFEADNNSECTLPLKVNFNNLSTQGSQFTYDWDFGNGQSYSGYNPPEIQYDEPGAFDVSLIVTNQITGCIDSFAIDDIVVVGIDPVYINFDGESGCAPFTVQLLSDTIPDGYQVLWEFGDGGNSEEVTPEHTYLDAGIYEVTLTVFRPGCPYPSITTDSIVIFGFEEATYQITGDDYCTIPVTFNFEYDGQTEVTPTWHIGPYEETGKSVEVELTSFGNFPVSVTLNHEEGCVEEVDLEEIVIHPFEVEVSDPEGQCYELQDTLSAHALDTSTIVNYEWHIIGPNGYHQVSADANPTVDLQDTGFYDVVLIATNERGCVDSFIHPAFYGVGVEIDVAFRALDTSTCLLDPVPFVDMSSELATGWLWDFGDGATEWNQNPIHEYGDYGIFTVILTAYNYGCGSSDTLEDYINVFPPVAYFEPRKICFDENNPFVVEFINGSAGYDSLRWDFGDGAPVSSIHFEENPTYTFTEPGVYNVTLWVFNVQTGCHHVKRNTVRIYDPRALLEIDTLFGCAPLTVTFSNQSLDAASADLYVGGELISRKDVWEEVVHTFTEGGIYGDIFLIAYDDAGCSDTFFFPDSIIVDELVPAIQTLGDTVCVGKEIYLFNQSFSFMGIMNIDNWQVEGYDRLNIENGVVNIVLDKPGSVDVTLEVSTPYGCKEVIKVPDLATAIQPDLSFDIQEYGCTYAEVAFVNESSGNQLSYTWEFGDGQKSTEVSPRHLYSKEGTYGVKLFAVDEMGCEAELISPVAVEIFDPLADWELDDSLGSCPPHIVHFTNFSHHGITYQWDFGDDAGLSVSEHPAHVYTAPGVYDVQLIAYRAPGCVDTLFVDSAVIVKGPDGIVEFNADTICAPAGVEFYAESFAPYYYTWDYGDGILDSVGGRVSSDTTSYEYLKPGEFYPRLIMTDEHNCQRAFQSDDPIIISALNADFEIPEISDCELPAAILPVVEVESLFGGEVEYSWLVTDSATQNQQLYSGSQPVIVLSEAGVYTIQLEVTNGYCTELIERKIVAALDPPLANFDLTDLNPCAGDTVHFTDLSVGGLGDIVAWNWILNNRLVSNDQHPSLVLEPGIQYEVRLEVVSSSGCRSDTIQTLVVQEDMKAIVTAVTDRCKGGEVTLHAIVLDSLIASNYYWMMGNDVLCTGCSDYTMQGELAHSTEFVFVMENALGCQGKYSIIPDTIASGGPEINLVASSDIVCADIPLSITLEGTDSEDQISWWTDAGAINCINDCNQIELIPDGSGIVNVTVTNKYGCVSEEQIPVDIIDDRFPFAGPDLAICIGESIEIDLSDYSNVNWIGLDVECLDCPVLSITPNGHEVFSVEATTASGCTIKDSLRIDVLPIVELYAEGDTLGCPGQQFELIGTGAELLYWQVGSEIMEQSNGTLTVNPNSNTSYVLHTNETACYVPDTIDIRVVKEANLTILGDTVCPGEPAYIQSSGLFDEIFWDVGALPYIHTGPNEIMVIPNENLTVKANASYLDCAEASDQTEVVVYEMQNALPPNMIYSIYEGESVTVDLGIDESVYDVVWGPFSEDLPCTFCTKFTFVPENEMTLHYTLYNNENACIDSGIVSIVLRTDCDQDLYFVPTAFSPNGDGQNDKLYVYKSPIALNIISFRVYDRWGNRVFETEDIGVGWDGVFEGQKMDPQVLVYVLEVPCLFDDSILLYKGDITLLR